MRRYLWWSALAAILALIVLVVAVPRLQQGRGPEASVIAGLATPESVAVGVDGDVYYISNLDRPGTPGDGFIARVVDGKVERWVTGLDDPKGIVLCGGKLYVADIDKVWQITLEGEKELLAGPEDFPVRPAFLNDTVCDSSGNLYVSDTRLGVIFKITPDGQADIFADREHVPELRAPNGLLFSGEDLLVLDFSSGKLIKIKPDGEWEVLAEGFGAGDGLAADVQGNFYLSDYRGGKVYRWWPDGERKVIAQGLKSPADIAVDLKKELLLIPEFAGNRLQLIPLGD